MKMNNQRGILAIISGFSGAGKGTVVEEILKTYDKEYCLSISATTRQPPERGKTRTFIFSLKKKNLSRELQKICF